MWEYLILFLIFFSGRRASSHYRRAAQNGRGTPEDAQGTRKAREGGAKNDSGQEQFAAQVVLLAEAWRLLGWIVATANQIYICIEFPPPLDCGV